MAEQLIEKKVFFRLEFAAREVFRFQSRRAARAAESIRPSIMSLIKAEELGVIEKELSSFSLIIQCED